MTIIERLPEAFTGANPVFAHGLGVAGVTNRWMAGALTESSGTAVAEWKPMVGAIPLTQDSAPLQPIVGTSTATPIPGVTVPYKVLRTDGVDDTISANSQLVNAKTITIVLRVLTAPGTTKGMAAWTGGYVSRGSTGTTSTVRTGASNLTQQVSADKPQFHVLTIINDFAGSVGATVIDDLYGVQATDRENNNIILGRGSSTSFGSIEVLDVTVWNRGLTQTECQTVREAHKKGYPGLIV